MRHVKLFFHVVWRVLYESFAHPLRTSVIELPRELD
jgi:hypothetical protein